MNGYYSVVEVSVPTILLFCVIHKDVDYLYKWQTFRPKSVHQSQISHAKFQSQISHAKFDSDEGLWNETSAIYINNHHLCESHRREELWERSSQLQN